MGFVWVDSVHGSGQLLSGHMEPDKGWEGGSGGRGEGEGVTRSGCTLGGGWELGGGGRTICS